MATANQKRRSALSPAIVGILVVAIAGVAECASYLTNFRAYAQAESLLRDVQAMRLDVTDDMDVQRIVQHYGGDVGTKAGEPSCRELEAGWKFYAADVQSGFLNYIGLQDRIHNTMFRQFGASIWRVDATFGVYRQHLACVSYQVESDPARTQDAIATAYFSAPYALASDIPYQSGFRDLHNVKVLNSSGTAGSGSQQRIFDVHIECLKRFGGCRAVCEIMPSAWHNYVNRARAEGDAIPEAEALDPRCTGPN
jgi:hypothetical protein